MDIELKPVKMAKLLLVLAVCFIMAQLVVELVSIYLERTFGYIRFNPVPEQSILRFYSAITLLLCSGLLLTIAVAKKADNTHSFLYWLGLALIFLFLAITKSTAFIRVFPHLFGRFSIFLKSNFTLTHMAS